jgi:4-hydroxy-3-polyprenylbenzoate decarboxylase
LASEIPSASWNHHIGHPHLIMPGIVAIQLPKYTTEAEAASQISELESIILASGVDHWQNLPLMVVCDDPQFTAAQLKNFLWVAFTRTNPSHDMHGVQAFTEHKHWGCKGPLIIDARIKPHHAPPVEKVPEIEKAIDRFFVKGAPLHGWG